MLKQHIKKQVLRRLKIIEGQLRGLQRLVDEEAYCIDIIHQSQAVKEALGSVKQLMLQNHLETHVIDQIRKGKSSKAIQEILSICKFSSK